MYSISVMRDVFQFVTLSDVRLWHSWNMRAIYFTPDVSKFDKSSDVRSEA